MGRALLRGLAESKPPTEIDDEKRSNFDLFLTKGQAPSFFLYSSLSPSLSPSFSSLLSCHFIPHAPAANCRISKCSEAIKYIFERRTNFDLSSSFVLLSPLFVVFLSLSPFPVTLFSPPLSLSRPGGELPHQVRLDHLDPVAVWVLNESDVPHRPLLGPLDELDLALVKVRDGGLEGRDGDADVAKALGLLVAVVVGLALFELGSWIMEKRKEKKIDCKPRDRASERASGAFFFFFFFGFPFCSTRGWCPCLDTLKQISLSLSLPLTVVVRQLEEARPAEDVLEPVPLVRGQSGLSKLEEVEREPLRLERERRREPHAEDARVECQGALRVLDADHRLLELEAARGLRAVGVDALWLLSVFEGRGRRGGGREGRKRLSDKTRESNALFLAPFKKQCSLSHSLSPACF